MLNENQGEATGGSDVPSDDAVILDDWVRSQVGPWLGRPPLEADLSAFFDQGNATDVNTFIFEVDGSDVRIRDKPESGRGPSYDSAYDRANGYKIWFAGVVEKFAPRMNMAFAVYVGDGASPESKYPIFSFQKPAGNRCLLLPDPDILGRDFPTADDTRRFDEKQCKAVFAGSTSGGHITKAALLANGAIPRIRAARYFKGHPDVDVFLPVLCQFDDDETADTLREMGFGGGRTVDFDEQLRRKFIMSIDGNGATCTRVSITLQSNSVLLKFDSPHQVCYSAGLRPWAHYVPISDYDDVIAAIEQERRTPGFFEPITRNAQDFAARFLTREALSSYTSRLLRAYHHLMPPCVAGHRRWRPLRIMAHVQDIGDLWADAEGWVGLPGSGLSIEGIDIEPAEGTSVLLSYRVLLAEDLLSPAVGSGRFCGSRGANQPLVGFCVDVGEPLSTAAKLLCWARFIDGTTIGPLPAGQLCRASTSVPLEAMKVEFSSG